MFEIYRFSCLSFFFSWLLFYFYYFKRQNVVRLLLATTLSKNYAMALVLLVLRDTRSHSVLAHQFPFSIQNISIWYLSLDDHGDQFYDMRSRFRVRDVNSKTQLRCVEDTAGAHARNQNSLGTSDGRRATMSSPIDIGKYAAALRKWKWILPSILLCLYGNNFSIYVILHKKNELKRCN